MQQTVEVLEPGLIERLPDFERCLKRILDYRPDRVDLVSHWDEPDRGNRRRISPLRTKRFQCPLRPED